MTAKIRAEQADQRQTCVPRTSNVAAESGETSLPIDTEVLFTRCMGNINFALSLLGELETSGKQQVDSIVQHVATAQPHDAAEAAHSLKGAAAILGAQPLQVKVAELEADARAGGSPRLTELAAQLQFEMDRFLVYVPTVRNNCANLGK